MRSNRLFVLPLLFHLGSAPSLLQGQDSREPVNIAVGIASPNELQNLLRDENVLFIKTSAFFDPTSAGKGSREPVWLAFRGRERVGVFSMDEVPPRGEGEEAKRMDFTKDAPGSWLTPGFCDALSAWFLDPASWKERGLDLSVKARERLQPWQKGWDELPLGSGITTVYVPPSFGADQAGPGALVKLDSGGDPEAGPGGALFLRLASPTRKATNLDRGKVAKTLASLLDAAKAYEKARRKWKKERKEYEKKRKAFLDWYRKNPLKPGDKEPSGATPAKKGKGRRSGRRMAKLTPELIEKILKRYPPQLRDRIRKQLEAQMKLQQARAAKAKAEAAPKDGKKTASAKDPKKKTAPKRPAFPKEPKRDPVKEALLEVLAGKRLLRVEVHRAEEIRAVLALAKERKIGKMVLVGASEAWKVAKEIRRAGVSVLLLPETVKQPGLELLPDHAAANAAALAREGVEFCFGSAGRESARLLPVLAAAAVARGADENAVLTALSRAAYESSGRDWKSGATGWVVWSEDPFAPTARVLGLFDGRKLRLLGGGR